MKKTSFFVVVASVLSLFSSFVQADVINITTGNIQINGAYIELAFSPGFNKGFGEINNAVFTQGYTQGQKSYMQFGIGWFNADRSPVLDGSGKLFGTPSSVPNGLGIPRDDLSDPNKAGKYLARPGIAWKSKGVSGNALKDGYSGAVTSNFTVGFKGDLYSSMFNSEYQPTLSNVTTLSSFGEKALGGEKQSNVFTWVCVDLTNIKDGTNFRIDSITISGINSINSSSGSINWAEENPDLNYALNVSQLEFGKENYFDISNLGIGTNSFGVDTKVYLAYDNNNNSLWNSWSIYAITSAEVLKDSDKQNAPTPEPASVLIFALGLAGLGLIRRKK